MTTYNDLIKHEKLFKKACAKTQVNVYPDSIHIMFDRLPPSENHAIHTKGWKRFPSKELKDWVKYVNEAIPEEIKLIKSPNPETNIKNGVDRRDVVPWLQAEIRIHLPLRNKTNGLVRKFDVQNRIKYLLDPVCDRLVWESGEKVDDKFFKRITATKINYNPEKAASKKQARFCEIIILPCPRLVDKLTFAKNFYPVRLVDPSHWEGREEPNSYRLLAKTKPRNYRACY